MYAGELVEMGETQDVLAEPKHPYTAALLAAIAIPDPRARKTFTGAPARIPTTSPPEHGCPFQPRCRFAVEQCVTERPAWEEITPGRRVRCHRAAELDLTPEALVVESSQPGR
jgi:oligopeptide/dipeptide ABC transporter ATP-binding protein